jgi:peptidoglycan/LPS O-acetylase OafA/YrhL
VPFIDCARGYAVLMVITTHVTAQYRELPNPVARVTASGWYGVQLFFLASCFTLLRSWHLERARSQSVDVTTFFIRRFFRIAPAYYTAGACYFFLVPPPGGFDLWQAIRAMTFVNAWYPSWIPTVADAWTVVPGGWSIGVEFSFYLVFPLFALWTTSLRRAGWLLFATIVLGVIIDRAAEALLAGAFRSEDLGNFLFFWFPNQMSVFALGGVLFFLLRDADRPGSRIGTWLRRNGTMLALAAITAFIILAYIPLGHYLGTTPYVPAGLAASIPLLAFFIGLSTSGAPLVNRPLAAMGQVSFSAYLVHFALLRATALLPEALGTRSTGYTAILAFSIGWVLVVSLTFIVSWVTFHAIEAPGMAMGKALIRARHRWRQGRPDQDQPAAPRSRRPGAGA